MMSVGLPLFQAERSYFIALEGLKDQEVDVDWELIISEEQESSIYKQFESANLPHCVDVKVDRPDFWIPLSQKWRRIADRMNVQSRGVMLQAADVYSWHQQIQRSYQALQDHVLYFTPYGYFYHIPSQTLALYDQSLSQHPMGISRAYTREKIQRLPDEDVKKGVDRWMFQNIINLDDPIGIGAGDPWQSGVSFDGLNAISTERGRMIALHLPPFRWIQDPPEFDIVEKVRNDSLSE